MCINMKLCVEYGNPLINFGELISLIISINGLPYFCAHISTCEWLIVRAKVLGGAILTQK